MAYVPDFSRNPKGKFDPRLNFVSIKNATDAYLLEDEFNEIQWIQSNEVAKLIKAMTFSGPLQASFKKNSNEAGAPVAHNYLIRDNNGNVIQTADIITSEDELNVFYIRPFYAVLDGYISLIDTGNTNLLKVPVEEPYPTSRNREDLVILEFWYRELRPHDIIPIYGGIDNDQVSYEMLDHRISIPTSNRVQLQWRIRCVPDDRLEGHAHYDQGRNKIELLEINPQGPFKSPNQNFSYKTDDNDPYLFIAGNGLSSSLALDTIDGYIRAIPLFEVHRLNLSGYNAVNNTNGGVNWHNTESISDRISLDGKFANVVYTNEIEDVRNRAYLGRNELDNRYTQISQFINFINATNEQIEINANNISTLITENENLRNELELLTAITL